MVQQRTARLYRLLRTLRTLSSRLHSPLPTHGRSSKESSSGRTRPWLTHTHTHAHSVDLSSMGDALCAHHVSLGGGVILIGEK